MTLDDIVPEEIKNPEEVTVDTTENMSNEGVVNEPATETTDEGTTEPEEQVSSLDLSDEDFAALGDAPPDVPPTEESAEVTEPVETAEDTENTEGTTDTEETAPKDISGEDTTTTAPETIDYKAEYNKVLAPFKANGVEIKIDNVDDAIQLMQKGANYNKKMAGLAPHLKIVKMLENNDILDEEKLSFLIDINNQNPEAIAKLLKDSNIDPMDIDTENAANYVKQTHGVSDNALSIQQAFDEIKDSPAYSTTVDVLSNQWDEKSQIAAAENPAIIGTINQHIEKGVYDEVMPILTREQALGRLNGLSDLEAYTQVGNYMKENKLFKAQQIAPDTALSNIVPKPAPNTATTQAQNNKRKQAAGSTRSTGSAKPLAAYNPLDLSDEEFSKIESSKYM